MSPIHRASSPLELKHPRKPDESGSLLHPAGYPAVNGWAREKRRDGYVFGTASSRLGQGKKEDDLEVDTLYHAPARALPLRRGSKQPSFLDLQIFVDEFERQLTGGNIEREPAEFRDPRQSLLSLPQQLFCNALAVDIRHLARNLGHKCAQIIVAYRHDQRQVSRHQRRGVCEKFGGRIRVDEISENHNE